MVIDSFYAWQSLPAPPVKERLKCPNCGKTRAIRLNREKKFTTHPIVHYFTKATGWRYAYPLAGHFCSLRCSNEFANDIIKEKLKKK